MEVSFAEKDKLVILERIRTQLKGRKLGELLEFSPSLTGFTVTISKLGTSTLEFAEQSIPDGLRFSLVRERIALSHRAFRGEVTSKLSAVIKNAGGSVTP